MAAQTGSSFNSNTAAGNLYQVGNVAGNAYFGHQHQSRKKEFLHWISSIDFTIDQEIILKKRYEQTGNWILLKEEFEEWIRSPVSRLLWCWGPPGIGKTVIASVVIDHLKSKTQTDSNMAVLYAYLKHDSREQQTALEIVASFIKQLCLRKKEIPEFLFDFFDDYDTSGRTPSLSEYILKFGKFVEIFNEVFIVIDALDECEDEQRKGVFEFLFYLTQRSNNVKVFITSRKEHDIQIQFNKLQTPIVPIEAKDVGDDIKHFVKGRVAELIKWEELRISNRSLQDKVESILVENAGGMFLWVNLQLEMLCKQKRERDVEEELQRLPPGLNATYQRIINDISKDEPKEQLLVKHCFMWVFYATRPLEVEEFLDAVSIDENCSSLADLSDNQWDETDILNSCRHLLVFEGSVVRPIHFSVREYFTNTIDDRESVLYDVRSERLACHHLATCCLQYLMLSGFPYIFEEISELRIFSKKKKFAAHSSFAFDEYIIRCGELSSDLRKLLQMFLDEQNDRLAPTLQLRRMKGSLNLKGVRSAFISQSVGAEDLICESRLYNSTQLLSVDPKWKDLKPPEDALHNAARADMISTVMTLLSQGLFVDAVDVHGITPLYYASAGGSKATVQLLLDNGANVNTEGGLYGNALQAASVGGHTKVVMLLIDHGANVNTQDGDYGNALYAASSRGHVDIVKLLLHKGAQVNAQSRNNDTALYTASSRGYLDIVKLLLDKGADVNAEGGHCDNSLQAASEGGHVEIVKLLLDKGASVNARGGHYGTALFAASEEGYTDIVKLLLDKGANANNHDEYRGTALQIASARGHIEIMKLLLERGAEVNIQSGHHGNALQTASPRGPIEIIKLLLDKGAEVNAQGGYYGNALQAASAHGLIERVKLLLEKGAEINAQGGHYGTALQAACIHDSNEIMKLLLDRGAKVNTQGGYYCTALQVASSFGHIEIVKDLLENEAEVNIQGGRYSTALQAASAFGHIEIVKVLLEKGAEVNAQGGYYNTALRAASTIGYTGVVKILLDKEAEVNIGSFGTPLYAASEYGHTEIVKLLLDKGAKVNVQGGTHGTALQIASNRGHKAILKLLQDSEDKFTALNETTNGPLESLQD